LGFGFADEIGKQQNIEAIANLALPNLNEEAKPEAIEDDRLDQPLDLFQHQSFHAQHPAPQLIRGRVAHRHRHFTQSRDRAIAPIVQPLLPAVCDKPCRSSISRMLFLIAVRRPTKVCRYAIRFRHCRTRLDGRSTVGN